VYGQKGKFQVGLIKYTPFKDISVLINKMNVDLDKCQEEFVKFKDNLNEDYKVINFNTSDLPYINNEITLECEYGHEYTRQVIDVNMSCTKCADKCKKFYQKFYNLKSRINRYETDDNLDKLVYKNNISNIENIEVDTGHLLSYPCQHFCKIFYKNGTTDTIILDASNINCLLHSLGKTTTLKCINENEPYSIKYLTTDEHELIIYNNSIEEFEQLKLEFENNDILSKKLDKKIENSFKKYLKVYEIKEDSYYEFFYKNNYDNKKICDIPHIYDILFDLSVLIEDNDSGNQEDPIFEISFGGNKKSVGIKEKTIIKNKYSNYKLDINCILLTGILYHTVSIKCNKEIIGIRYNIIEITNHYKRYKVSNNKSLSNDIYGWIGMYGMRDRKYTLGEFFNENDVRQDKDDDLVISLKQHKANLISYLKTLSYRYSKQYSDLTLQILEDSLGEKIDLDLNSEYETPTKKMDLCIIYTYDEDTNLYIDSKLK